MIDLLMMAYTGKITIEKGNAVLDETIHNMNEGRIPAAWWESIGLSRFEATAHAHGADLEGLLFLRYQGWPEKCSKCEQPIDYKQFGWRLTQEEGQPPKLMHLLCPKV